VSRPRKLGAKLLVLCGIAGFNDGGYPLDSGSPYRLWFGLGLPWGRVDDLVVGDGTNGHSLLCQAIEELSAAS
jgi:hypothetical protein